jgi:chromosome segregation ATPase
MSLQDRIANMAATREAGNKQLSGQIQKLRQQLDKSKRLQHESQAQVGALKESFTTAKHQLMKEQVTSRTHAATAAELQQRLANLRATGSKAVSSPAAAGNAATGEHSQTQAATQEFNRAAEQLREVNNQVHELKLRLAEEVASKEELSATAEELRQRLINLRATGQKQVAATQAAAAAVVAAKEREGYGPGESRSRPHSPSAEVERLREEHQRQLTELQQQLRTAVAAAEEAGHAALQEQQQQLEALQQQLAASRAQAEAAQAAEEVAREQVMALKLQLQQQEEAVRRQAEALEAAKAEMLRLREKAARNREYCVGWCLQGGGGVIVKAANRNWLLQCGLSPTSPATAAANSPAHSPFPPAAPPPPPPLLPPPSVCT